MESATWDLPFTNVSPKALRSLSVSVFPPVKWEEVKKVVVKAEFLSSYEMLRVTPRHSKHPELAASF